MALKRLNSFAPIVENITASPHAEQFLRFEWKNLPAEDAAFVTWAYASLVANYTAPQYAPTASIVRSGGNATLRIQWPSTQVPSTPQNPNPAPVPGPIYTVAMPAGTWWGRNAHATTTPGYSTQVPGVVDVEGAWECDEYGRPYDVQAIKHY